jgi:hypothetical protein
MEHLPEFELLEHRAAVLSGRRHPTHCEVSLVVGHPRAKEGGCRPGRHTATQPFSTDSLVAGMRPQWLRHRIRYVHTSLGLTWAIAGQSSTNAWRKEQ